MLANGFGRTYQGQEGEYVGPGARYLLGEAIGIHLGLWW